jgi:transcription antitermination factor NusG
MGGKNYKGIDEKEKKEKIEVGSSVNIVSGTHKEMKGKIIAISDN